MMERPNRNKQSVLAFSRSRGFTLLEIMVVVLIIGIIMSFAALTVSTGGDRRVEQEAKRFTALMKLAADQAILNAQDMVVELKKSAYHFAFLDINGKPQPFPADSPFRDRELPDGLELRAEIEGEEVFLSDAEEPDNPAYIFIFSSGEMSPFIVEVRTFEEKGMLISGDYPGNVVFKGRAQEE